MSRDPERLRDGYQPVKVEDWHHIQDGKRAKVTGLIDLARQHAATSSAYRRELDSSTPAVQQLTLAFDVLARAVELIAREVLGANNSERGGDPVPPAVAPLGYLDLDQAEEGR